MDTRMGPRLAIEMLPVRYHAQCPEEIVVGGVLRAVSKMATLHENGRIVSLLYARKAAETPSSFIVCFHVPFQETSPTLRNGSMKIRSKRKGTGIILRLRHDLSGEFRNTHPKCWLHTLYAPFRTHRVSYNK